MAVKTSITLTHGRASDLRVGTGEPARQVLNKCSRLFDGAVGGAIIGATGFVLETGQSSGTVTLAGGADDVEVHVGGFTVGPVAAGDTDADTATTVAAMVAANTNLSALVTATSAGAVVTLMAVAAGRAGNLGLSTSTSVGTATASGATLTGGATTAYTF